MKKLLIIFLSVFLITGLVAQSVKKDVFYLSAEGVFGYYSGATIGLNYMPKQMLIFQLGIHALSFKSDQYQGETFWGREYDATNAVNGCHFLVGKVFSWEGSGRMILSAGIGSFKKMEPVSSKTTHFPWIDRNITSIEYEESRSLTYVLNPKIELPFSDTFGISLTSLLLANKEEVVFGIGIGFILGALK